MLANTQTSTRYTDVDETKSTGSHYTPTNLAEFVASELGVLLKNTSKIRILDPAIGDGELILALLNELQESSYTFEVIGFDIDEDALELAEQRIKNRFGSDVLTDLRHVDFLEFATHLRQPTLFTAHSDFPLVDVVISNPPYIRTQIIGSEKAQQLAQTFGLSGRVDLSYAFLKAIEWVLKPKGFAGVIVSNRFMTTKSGAAVRKNLREGFHIRHIWDLGDTKLFDAAVLPSVLLLEKGNTSADKLDTGFSKVYATQQAKTHDRVFKNVVEAFPHSGVVQLEDGQCFCIEHGYLAKTDSDNDVWRISTNESRAWLEKVKINTHCLFGDLGKIRVGVKTTADKVFIRDDWHTFDEDDLPELLRPLMTHHIGRRFRADSQPDGRKILYTHEYRNGKRQAIRLADYPNAAVYLEANRTKLESRKYVQKAGRNWYEIWVPQDPKMWCHPKLIFRDIVDRPTFWLDFSGAVVNGDCYWMTLDRDLSDDLDMLWLALAVANSTFIEAFYDHRFNNKLYAGRRRYITQYVEKFPMPDPQTGTAREIVKLCKQIYDQILETDIVKQENQLDKLVWQAFGF